MVTLSDAAGFGRSITSGFGRTTTGGVSPLKRQAALVRPMGRVCRIGGGGGAGTPPPISTFTQPPAPAGSAQVRGCA
ncbi:hypothetical protein ACFQU2_24430 [Siccirubricoccus deserti]